MPPLSRLTTALLLAAPLFAVAQSSPVTPAPAAKVDACTDFDQ